MILSGYNSESISDIDQCCVSPVAVNKIMEPRLSSNQSICAYYLFASEGKLLHEAFSVVLRQLFRQRRQALRNKSQSDELRVELHELRKHQDEDERNMESKDNRISAFTKIALRVMNFFDKSQIVDVILDRADRCCDLKNGIDHRKPLLKALVKMVEAARCRVKVIVVINGYQWDIEQRQD